MSNNSFAIDEFGRLYRNEKLCDENSALGFLENIKRDSHGHFLINDSVVEVFDQPIVIQKIEIDEDKIFGFDIYKRDFEINLSRLSLDVWDRLMGVDGKNTPFVLNKKAQSDFFAELADYDDESITYGDKTYETPIADRPEPELAKDELSPSLQDMLPRLKLPKSRIAVVGENNKSNADYLRSFGYIVTEAKSARALEGNQIFDVIYHSGFQLYDIAEQKKSLTQCKKLTIESGFLFLDIILDPIYTEWHYREVTQKHLQYLFWNRWKKEIDSSLSGKRLFVYGVFKKA